MTSMKLKRFWVLMILCILSFLLIAQWIPAGTENTGGINWHLYSEGMALSQEENKKVFLYFWAEWCAYCTKMAKETFVDPGVVNYLNNAFISIKVDYDREPKLASEYGVRGLPTSYFLAETGDRIGGRPGFISARDLLSTLRYIETDSYKTMTLKTFLKDK
ncbi:MAG: thioredoxin fold domain-containing protein [Deltaproteobacteria bacterium]|nr:thioredoxin fold domain-containing protein [Deltaproteobacteria bacterium]